MPIELLDISIGGKSTFLFMPVHMYCLNSNMHVWGPLELTYMRDCESEDTSNVKPTTSVIYKKSGLIYMPIYYGG